jgi:hypothetical protein
MLDATDATNVMEETVIGMSGVSGCQEPASHGIAEEFPIEPARQRASPWRKDGR